MRHEYIGDEHHELIEARDAAVRNLGFAAMQLTSVNEIYLTEQFLGCVSDETQQQANEAGMRYNDAIRSLLLANEAFKNI
jgi:hypothetical protein